ncbi:MAG: histidine phosphatase family protein [bacterium]|nr:histidine phosphatase family protein [bacterium]
MSDKYSFLVRHGETKLNKAVVFRGHVEVELNEAGLEQAQLAGERFKEIPIDKIYSSPLKRAFQTASAIGKHHNLETEIKHAFNDMNLGLWEGMEKKAVAEKYPEQWDLWVNNPVELKIPDAETLNEVSARSFSELTKIANELLGNRIVIVTHRIICKLLILNVFGISLKGFWKIHQDTCCINLFKFNTSSGWSVVKLNDTSHLDKGKLILKEDF